MILTLTAAVALVAATIPAFDGSRLRPGDSCYAMTTAGNPSGAILRRVVRAKGDASAPWSVTILSRLDGERYETRLTLEYADLRPIEVRDHGGLARYFATGVIDVNARGNVRTLTLPQPIWDASGLEILLTALPLADGAHFDVPVYGGGAPRVTSFEVSGAMLVDTPDGVVEAWRVIKYWSDGTPVIYLVAKSDRRLLGIDVGRVSSRLGGDCSGLEK